MHKGEAATGAMSMQQATAVGEALRSKAAQCDRYNIHFCVECSAKAAGKNGVLDLICPKRKQSATPQFA